MTITPTNPPKYTAIGMDCNVCIGMYNESELNIKNNIEKNNPVI